jgi:hypothetical protein
MTTFIQTIVLMIYTLVYTLFDSAFRGFLVWGIWDLVIPYIFPKIVLNGYILANPSLLECIGFVWLMTLVLKTGGLTFKGRKNHEIPE